MNRQAYNLSVAVDEKIFEYRNKYWSDEDEAEAEQPRQ